MKQFNPLNLYNYSENYTIKPLTFKTINGESILGSGDIKLESASDSYSKSECDEKFAEKSAIANFITKDVDNLTNYTTTTNLESTYTKKTDADSTYAKKNEISSFITKDVADLTNYTTTTNLESTYTKKTDADSTYAKKSEISSFITKDVDNLTNYTTTTNLDTNYLKKTDAESTYTKKTDAESTYLKKTDKASDSVLGAIKIGEGLSIDGEGKVSVSQA